MKWGLPLSNLGDMTYVRNCTATDTGFHSDFFFYFFIYGFSWAVMVAMKRLQLNNAAIMSLIIFLQSIWIDIVLMFSIDDCYEYYVLLNIFPWNTIKAGTSTHVEPIAYDGVVLLLMLLMEYRDEKQLLPCTHTCLYQLFVFCFVQDCRLKEAIIVGKRSIPQCKSCCKGDNCNAVLCTGHYDSMYNFPFYNSSKWIKCNL